MVALEQHQAFLAAVSLTREAAVVVLVVELPVRVALVVGQMDPQQQQILLPLQ